MRAIPIIFLLLFHLALFAQSDDEPVTRALVVGISGYQSEELPDLQYARRDAAAFAEWLQSPQGKGLPAEQIRLLTDEQATYGRLLAAFHWLLRESRRGDRVILYFSGHTGLEDESNPQSGYLLPYDAPGNVFPAGAIGMGDLRKVASRLQDFQRSEVWLVLDAPHAAGLAGEEGLNPLSELTRSFPAAVQLLASRAGQIAQEGAQWGGGRSLFTHFLLEGLKGPADADGDGAITLQEMESYSKKQMKAVGPAQPQEPLFTGSPGMVLHAPGTPTAKEVDSTTPATTRSGTSGTPEEQAFHQAITDGRLLEPAGESAYDLFRLLAANPEVAAEPLRQQLAAALIDAAQQVIPQYLQRPPLARVPGRAFPERVKESARYLERAAELLDRNPFIRDMISGKQAFLEGLALRLEANSMTDTQRAYEESLRALNQAMAVEGGAHVYNEIGRAYLALGEAGRALLHFRKAAEMSPQWLPPLVQTAHILHLLGRPEEGLPYAEEAIELAPDAAGGYLVKGMLQQDLPQYDEAEKLYQQALEKDPSSTAAMIRLGSLHAQRGQYGKGENMLKKALTLDAQNLEAYEALAQLYRRWGKPEQGITTGKRAVQLNPDSPAAHNQLGRLYQLAGQNDEAEKHFRRAMELDPNDNTALINLGRLYAETGRTEVGIGYYEEAITLDERDIEPYLLMGRLYESTKNEAAVAENLYRQAIRISPEAADGYFYLGSLLRRQGKAKEAQEQLEKGLQLDPDDTGAQNSLALTLRDLGEHEKAETILKKLTRESPNDPLAFFNLGLLYQENLQRYDAAEKMYRRAIELQPDDAAAYSNLSALLRQQGRDAEADALLAEAMEQGLADAGALYEAGIDHLRAGRRAKAREQFEQAVEVDPHFAKAHYQLGLLSSQANEWNEAAEALSQALEIDPDFTDATYELAKVYQQLGESEKAASLYQQLQEDRPQDFRPFFREAFLHYQEGEDREAVPPLQRAMALAPDSITVLTLGGAVYARLGNLAKAEELYNQVLELAPDYAPGYFNLGRLKFRQQEFSSAAAALERADELAPGNATTLFLLGQAYANDKKYAQAAEAWEKAREVTPEDLNLLHALGRLYLEELKDYQKTAAIAQAIQQFRPADLEALRMQGYVALYENRYEEAKVKFNQLVRREPDVAGHYYNMAALYSRWDESREAFEWLERALRRGYNDVTKLKEDPDLENIRDSRRFRRMVVEYLEKG